MKIIPSLFRWLLTGFMLYYVYRDLQSGWLVAVLGLLTLSIELNSFLLKGTSRLTREQIELLWKLK